MEPNSELFEQEPGRERAEESDGRGSALHTREELVRVLEERESWTLRELEQALARAPRRREALETDSGIPIPDILDPASRSGGDYLRDLGYPGRFPFTRGTQLSMYRGRLWTMRQFSARAARCKTRSDTESASRTLSTSGPDAIWEGRMERLSLQTARLRAVPATAAHAREIQTCFENARAYFLETEGRPPSPTKASELLADVEVDGTRRVLAILPRSGGRAVGVLDLYLHYPEPDVAQIGLLLFRESCQGLGYGREMVAALEQALARAGLRELRLSVVEENGDAKLFWEAMGYAQVGRLERGVTVFEKALQI